MARVNMDLVGPLDVDESAMSVVITGGTGQARAILKEVIFGAIEGAGFQNVDYIPDHREQMPCENVTTLLEECKALNPEIFETQITVEAARLLYEPEIPNQEAWDKITQAPRADGTRMIEIQGGITKIHF